MNPTLKLPPAKKNSEGFTLIELLTVIAIIGILAGIIIPVVGKVRLTAQSARSTSNIRQLTMANILFEQDYRAFASGNDWNDNQVPSTRTWHERVAKYAGFPNASFGTNGSNPFVAGEQPPGAFAMPANDWKVGEGESGSDSNFRSPYSRSGSVYVNDGNVASGGSVRSMKQVNQPSKSYLVSDWGHWDTWGANNITTFPGFFGGKYTFGYFDGHVKSFQAGQLPIANPGTAGADLAFWDARVR